MDCDHVRELMHAYLDGELDLTASLEWEQHRAGCAGCAAASDAAASLRDAIRAPEQYFRAPDMLDRRIRNAVAQAQPAVVPAPPKPRTLWGASRFAIAACLLLAAIAVWRYAPWPRRGQGPDLAAEIVAGHVRSLLPGHLMDVPSSDSHTVKPWFAGRVDFSPRVVDLVDKGFPLSGARLDYIGGRTVAVLVYHRRQHTINVFVWPASGASPSGPPTALRGYNMVQWYRDNLSYWAISDLNAPELSLFAQFSAAP